MLSALLVFRQLGIWWSDPLVWPLVLAAFGAALLWQRSRRSSEGATQPAAPPARAPRERAPRSRTRDPYSGVFGVLLVIGAALLFLFGTAMALSFGLKSPLDYSVFSAAAVAILLAAFAGRGREESGKAS